MNRETYGKRCNCNHYESEHTLQKHDFSEPRVIPEMGILFTHPPGMIKEPVRSGCKICDCKNLIQKRGMEILRHDN
ncbi:MAG: hypothetical protein OEM28_04460 [Nitrosopumilus sp.]|nr:hypothetical protein [Nitrosopumilus sp.]MDH3486641.1 hypothetical protein [Nitrosopumilus sp.]